LAKKKIYWYRPFCP